MSAPANIKDRHLLCWREAFMAKLCDSGKPYGKAELDKLLQRYDAITDAPCVNFSDELLAAYPNAKVILSKRDPERWLESIQRSYHAVIESRVFRIAAAIDPALTLLDEVFRLVLIDWTGGDWRNRQKLLKAYHRHNEHIRQVVPKGRLLEWEPRDGWQPLCEFLGKDVPDEPFPYANKGDDVAKGVIKAARYRIVRWVLGKMVVPGLGVVVAVGGWIVYRRIWS
ncbi:hypothetical protein PRZ48_014160 [Zasmidium cellare]|uniref:NAD dependent epimerase/dehydratase n=1 Tax=Zasmidium cellare TaxID=395010 RepID=A0ABR0E0C7_ZASCE|nr:hypothetical protein PRZ48_014160 [Zasmidium cellare]